MAYKKALYHLFGHDSFRDELCTDPSGKKLWRHTIVHKNFRCYCASCGMVFHEKPTIANGNRLGFDYVFDITQIKN